MKSREPPQFRGSRSPQLDTPGQGVSLLRLLQHHRVREESQTSQIRTPTSMRASTLF